MYGMGVQSIANEIGGTKEEAKEILDGFYNGFPNVKKWTIETEEFAKKNGYVEDWFGRKRRLPSITLPQYEVKYKDPKKILNEFNPFLMCSNREVNDTTLSNYLKKCEQIKSKRDYEQLKNQASKDGVEIKSNSALISRATRQCVNARIQGGAATMTKIAMIQLFNDQELKDLDFHMLIGVHDELIGECPEINAEKVAERLTYIMKNCIKEYCIVPFKCDASIGSHWYIEEWESSVNKDYKDLIKKLGNESQAFDELCEIHCEASKEELAKIINK